MQFDKAVAQAKDKFITSPPALLVISFGKTIFSFKNYHYNYQD